MEAQTPTDDGVPSPTLKASDLPNLNEPQEIVLINVRGTLFRVHKNYICHYSPFFDAAFNSSSSFLEYSSQEMRLDDISSMVFGILVSWLYSQEIQDGKGGLPTCRMLVDLWILADRFMIPPLQNQSIEKLNDARLAGKVFTSDIPRRIYANTSEDSALRAYLVDMCIEGTTAVLRDTDPPQFLVDVINGMRIRLDAKSKNGGSDKQLRKWTPSKKWMKVYHVDENVGRRGHSVFASVEKM